MGAQLKAIVDKLLTNTSRGLFFDPNSDFIANRILTPVTTTQLSGKIGYYSKAHLRILNTVTGGRGQAPMIDVDTKASDSYVVEKNALKTLVTEEDYADVEQPFDAESDAIAVLTSHLLLGKEYALSSYLMSTTNITQNTTLTGTDQHSDLTNSDPLGDFKTARVAVRDGCGFAPNKCIMDWGTAEVLMQHPQILETLGYKNNRVGELSYEELRSVLKVDELLIGKAKYNSSNFGQTASLSNVWGKHILFVYAPNTPSKRIQTLGFRVTKSNEGVGGIAVYRSMPDDPVNSTQLLEQYWEDTVITDTGAAYLIYNAIA